MVNLCISYILSGQIRAIKDCWIIEDLFINDIYYALAEANKEKFSSQQKKLHIYNNYNMKCYSSNSLSKAKEAPVRLVNALIHALNDHDGKNKKGTASEEEIPKFAPFLPRFIIMIPDWDIIKHIGHYKYGVTIIAEKVVNWIVKNIERSIEIRHEDLTRIKKGATVSTEPKIVWVTMIDRVGCCDKALAIHSKFNRILEDILVDYKNQYIADFSRSMNDSAYFHDNLLNRNGAMRYWSELD